MNASGNTVVSVCAYVDVQCNVRVYMCTIYIIIIYVYYAGVRI